MVSHEALSLALRLPNSSSMQRTFSIGILQTAVRGALAKRVTDTEHHWAHMHSDVGHPLFGINISDGEAGQV